MKTNNLLLLGLFAVTIFMGSCASKKYMRTAFDMIKISFPDATTKMEGNDIKIIFPQNDMFDSGSSVLKSKFVTRVTKFSEILNKYKDTKLKITGHTDNTGKTASNLQLSKDRALHVQESLVSHGVSANRISYMGMGETMPIADNKTEAGRAENRRVEFIMSYSK